MYDLLYSLEAVYGEISTYIVAVRHSHCADSTSIKNLKYWKQNWNLIRLLEWLLIIFPGFRYSDDNSRVDLLNLR